MGALCVSVALCMCLCGTSCVAWCLCDIVWLVGHLQLLEHGDGEGAEAEDGEQHDADGGELDDALVAEHVGELGTHTQRRGHRKGFSDVEVRQDMVDGCRRGRTSGSSLRNRSFYLCHVDIWLWAPVRRYMGPCDAPSWSRRRPWRHAGRRTTACAGCCG